MIATGGQAEMATECLRRIDTLAAVLTNVFKKSLCAAIPNELIVKLKISRFHTVGLFVALGFPIPHLSLLKLVFVFNCRGWVRLSPSVMRPRIGPVVPTSGDRA